MDRAIAVVGAPSSLGIRPYDDGVARYLDRAPGVLRQRGIISRLRAFDLGDVPPPAYRDFVRPPGRARNEQEVLAYSRSRSEEHTSELQSLAYLVCRLLLEKKKKKKQNNTLKNKIN